MAAATARYVFPLGLVAPAVTAVELVLVWAPVGDTESEDWGFGGTDVGWLEAPGDWVGLEGSVPVDWSGED